MNNSKKFNHVIYLYYYHIVLKDKYLHSLFEGLGKVLLLLI